MAVSCLLLGHWNQNPWSVRCAIATGQCVPGHRLPVHGSLGYCGTMQLKYRGRLHAPTLAERQQEEIHRFLLWAIGPGGLVVDSYGTIESGTLYRYYHTWAVKQDAEPMSEQAFGRMMTHFGSPALKGTAGVRLRGGLRLP